MNTQSRTAIQFFIFFILSSIHTTIGTQCDLLPPEGISPFFSFEYAVLKKNSFVVSEELLFIKQEPHSAWILFMEAYYGITKNVTLVAFLPIFSQKPLPDNPGKKTGLGDLLLQANFRIYNNETDDYRYRIIGTSGIQFPTATVAEKNLFTFNTTSFFLGITQDAVTRDWYFYSNFSALLNIKRHHLKFGDILNFNSGIGKIYCIHDTIFTIFAELSDFYSRPNRFNTISDLTTGENYLFLGPSFRLKHGHYLLQGGIQYVVSHHARVANNAIKYSAGVFGSYSF